MMYHINGASATVEGHTLEAKHGMQLDPTLITTVEAPNGEVRVLVLQGRPIDQPVAQHGPFVMNTRQEIVQAFSDYQRTQFGGWPWGASDVVHPRQQGRFALLSNGATVHPPSDSNSTDSE